MDKSRYRVFFGLLLSDADKEKVRNKMTSAVGMLHQEGFVMGTFLIDVHSASPLASCRNRP